MAIAVAVWSRATARAATSSSISARLMISGGDMTMTSRVARRMTP